MMSNAVVVTRSNRCNVPRPAVFLDRDGVLIADSPDYIRRPEEVRLLPGVPQALARLKRSDLPLVLVTNQAVVGHGLITEAELSVIHERMCHLIRESDSLACLDRIYFCPYHPEARLDRYRRRSAFRKPGSGMLVKAAWEMNLDLGRSFLIGDRETDIVAASRVGCVPILVLTGLEQPKLASWASQPAFIADTIASAVEWILARV
jgi:D-glycero-D-manno-heptose 1,7-bisphosphate phosphatase